MRRRSHSTYLKASGCELALPHVSPRYRNLNRFPFRQARLRLALGPTYPRLTTHCRGTLAPSMEGILTPLRCYFHQDRHLWPVHWISQPSFHPTTTPAYQRSSALRSEVSAPSLAPSIFSAPNLDWSAVTHCLEDGCF